MGRRNKRVENKILKKIIKQSTKHRETQLRRVGKTEKDTKHKPSNLWRLGVGVCVECVCGRIKSVGYYNI